MEQHNKSIEDHDFPKPIGSPTKIRKKDQKKLTDDDFIDYGVHITDEDQAIKDSLPKPRGTLTLDPVCLSCTGM